MGKRRSISQNGGSSEKEIQDWLQGAISNEQLSTWLPTHRSSIQRSLTSQSDKYQNYFDIRRKRQ